MGFVKLHDQIFNSSIIEEDLTTRWVWICLLLSCDKNGNIYGTSKALARRANVSLEEFEEALELLMSPDPESTTPDHEGRRVLEVGPNLYHCVNYTYYRGLRDPDEQRERWRERKARQREREKEAGDGEHVGTDTADAVQSDGGGGEEKATGGGEGQEEEKKKGKAAASKNGEKEKAVKESFERFWSFYPRKIAKKRALIAWRNLTAKDRADAIEVIPYHADVWQMQGRGTTKIPHASTWLNQERWNDDLEAELAKDRKPAAERDGSVSKEFESDRPYDRF